MRAYLPLCILLTACVGNAHPTPAAAPTWAPLFGFHAGYPAKYSAAVGAAAVISRRFDEPNPRSHDDRDIFVLAEPGWSTGRASVGYGVEHDHFKAVTLINVRASALRRWRDGPPRDYAGVELCAVTMEELSLGARIGVFKQVDGARARRPFLFSIDFPVGW